jgi:hypothetical protein
MELLYAFFGALWTWGVIALALYWWRAPDRWRRDGRMDNGLGTVVIIDDSRRSVRFWLLTHRVFAAFGFLMGAAGAVITIGWLWKALSGLLS